MNQNTDTTAETHERLTPHSPWYNLSSIPEGFFRRRFSPGAVTSSEEALTLPAFWAGLRRYQSTLSRLPIVTYQYNDDGSRGRARQHPAYRILHDIPNPAQTRSVFVGKMVHDLFTQGNFYAQIRWRGNGNIYGIYPLCPGDVERIDIDDDWNKSYKLTGIEEPLPSSDIIHVFIHSRDGVKGRPLVDYAAESLGLHKQIQDSATNYYQHVIKPDVYVKIAPSGNAPKDKEALETAKKTFKDKYQGAANAGEIPFVKDMDILPFPGTSATDSEIIQALSGSVGDIARWFNLDPLLLGDRSSAWSNLAAANASFYQYSLAELLDNIQSEFSNKIFGADGKFYCEFLTESLLEGDPVQQSQIWQTGITSGYLLRSEIRSWLNLTAVDGLDQPTFPLNQGQQVANPTTPYPQEPAQEPA